MKGITSRIDPLNYSCRGYDGLDVQQRLKTQIQSSLESDLLKDAEEYGKRILRTWVLNVEGGMNLLRFFQRLTFVLGALKHWIQLTELQSICMSNEVKEVDSKQL
jgi:hypothetical protein